MRQIPRPDWPLQLRTALLLCPRASLPRQHPRWNQNPACHHPCILKTVGTRAKLSHRPAEYHLRAHFGVKLAQRQSQQQFRDFALEILLGLPTAHSQLLSCCRDTRTHTCFETESETDSYQVQEPKPQLADPSRRPVCGKHANWLFGGDRKQRAGADGLETVQALWPSTGRVQSHSTQHSGGFSREKTHHPQRHDFKSISGSIAFRSFSALSALPEHLPPNKLNYLICIPLFNKFAISRTNSNQSLT